MKGNRACPPQSSKPGLRAGEENGNSALQSLPPRALAGASWLEVGERRGWLLSRLICYVCM
jgi:hypothetical protein